MKGYKCLNKQEYKTGDYQLVPIRDEDRYLIMEWRNEQIYHLRQDKYLSKKNQDIYFEDIVNPQKKEKNPDQILFSLLEGDSCIAYGGLVHINWEDKNGEISFVMKTALEKERFVMLWDNFLRLIKQVAFKELDLHKIYTYAFDIRPKLYEPLVKNGFIKEGHLRDHCIIDSKYYDVFYHSLLNPLHSISIRDVKKEDEDLLFNWRNDPEVRANAFNTDEINLENHRKWFANKLADEKCKIYIFESFGEYPIGQVRLELLEDKWMIDYSIDSRYRGIGLGEKIIYEIVKLENGKNLFAQVKQKNIASVKIFENQNFRVKSVDKEIINFELER